MKVQVEMRAFQNGVIREVTIPDAAWMDAHSVFAQCELAFYYGQNEIQNVPGRCSVSVGDVVRIAPDSLYRVEMVGFQKIGD